MRQRKVLWKEKKWKIQNGTITIVVIMKFILSPYKVCSFGELHAEILTRCSNSRLRKCVCMKMCVHVATYFLNLGFSASVWYVLAAHGHTIGWRWFLFCCLLFSLACRTAHHFSYTALWLTTCFLQFPFSKAGLVLCVFLSVGPGLGSDTLWGLNDCFLNEPTKGS